MFTLVRLFLLLILLSAEGSAVIAQDSTDTSRHSRSLVGINYSRYFYTPHVGFKIQHRSFGLELSFNSQNLGERGPFFSTHLVSIDFPIRIGNDPIVNPLLGIGGFSRVPIGTSFWLRFLRPVYRVGIQVTPSPRIAFQMFLLRGQDPLSGYSFNILVPLKKMKNR